MKKVIQCTNSKDAKTVMKILSDEGYKYIGYSKDLDCISIEGGIIVQCNIDHYKRLGRKIISSELFIKDHYRVSYIEDEIKALHKELKTIKASCKRNNRIHNNEQKAFNRELIDKSLLLKEIQLEIDTIKTTMIPNKYLWSLPILAVVIIAIWELFKYLTKL